MSKIFDYEIKFDSAGLEKELLDDFGIGGKVQKRWDYIVLNGMKPYTPFREGILQRSADISTVLGDGEIIYRTPYARRLYYNPQFNFNKEHNALAGGEWAERAANDLLPAWIGELQRFINGGI